MPRERPNKWQKDKKKKRRHLSRGLNISCSAARGERIPDRVQTARAKALGRSTEAGVSMTVGSQYRERAGEEL